MNEEVADAVRRLDKLGVDDWWDGDVADRESQAALEIICQFLPIEVTEALLRFVDRTSS